MVDIHLQVLHSLLERRLLVAFTQSPIKLRYCTNINKGIFRGVGRVFFTCLQALRVLVNPPLQVIENGATLFQSD